MSIIREIDNDLNTALFVGDWFVGLQVRRSCQSSRIDRSHCRHGDSRYCTSRELLDRDYELRQRVGGIVLMQKLTFNSGGESNPRSLSPDPCMSDHLASKVDAFGTLR